MDKSPILTLKQAAAIHGLSPALLAYYITTGRGPTHSKLGRYYYFERADVEAWEKPPHKPFGPKPGSKYKKRHA